MKQCNTYWTWLVALVVGSFQQTSSMIQNCEQHNKQCIKIYNCTSALEAVKVRNVELLRNMFCGFDANIPKVCCPVDIPIVFEGSMTQNPTTVLPAITKLPTVTKEDNIVIDPTHTSNGLPTTQVCGISGSISDRIIGGSITGIDEFPWLARISIAKRNSVMFSCGGSLITRQFVVTAAHCVVNRQVKGVRLGEWDTETETDCVDDYCSDPPLDVKVIEVIVHPAYKRLVFNGDIALLRLEKSINYTDFIRPVCLPINKNVADQDYVPGTAFTTAGWGKTELGSLSVIKQKVNLDTVPLEVCKIKSPQINNIDFTKILCAGGKVGKDTCNGDSGGPLVKEITENFKTNWYLFGIISFGAKDCGLTDTPSVNTRIVSYMDWIIKNINA